MRPRCTAPAGGRRTRATLSNWTSPGVWLSVRGGIRTQAKIVSSRRSVCRRSLLCRRPDAARTAGCRRRARSATRRRARRARRKWQTPCQRSSPSVAAAKPRGRAACRATARAPGAAGVPWPRPSSRGANDSSGAENFARPTPSHAAATTASRMGSARRTPSPVWSRSRITTITPGRARTAPPHAGRRTPSLLPQERPQRPARRRPRRRRWRCAARGKAPRRPKKARSNAGGARDTACEILASHGAFFVPLFFGPCHGSTDLISTFIITSMRSS